MRRQKHSLSHYKLMTCDMGKLYPIGCFEVLPGDTVQQATQGLIRVSPLLAPVMHPVSIRIHHWFVPNRLVWDGWEDFITGGPDGLGGSAGPYPETSTATVAKDMWDYLGVPPGTTVSRSLLPIRAINMIFNENYRDQDLVTERAEDDSSLPSVAWEKDYFTAARPWTQKGPEVTLPLGQVAPVEPAGGGAFTVNSTAGVRNMSNILGSNNVVMPGSVPGTEGVLSWANPALQANLATATAAGVNDIRRAFALQRYQEARAQYGSRYTEYLRFLGVKSSDARLQRPEYLGGGKQTISFTEIIRTGSESQAPIGELFGHGIAGMRSRRYRRFFEEHGHVVSLLSVRPRTMYNDGVEKMWSRRTKEDYWQRELELIGQQEIFQKEIYAASATPDAVFGYNDRYSEYRHIWSKIAGDFRSTLNYWHLARQFAADPVLNASFITCDPSKRIHAVQTEDVLWCMFSHSIQARRMVTRKTIGRIM